jgi:hypothetical protein
MADRGAEDGRAYVDWFYEDGVGKKQVKSWLGIRWKGDASRPVEEVQNDC